MAPIEDVVSGTTRATTLAKPGSPRSRAYVTFLHGKGEGVTSVVRLAEDLRKVNSAYPLVVAVLPHVLEEHRCMLAAQGCIVREIEPVDVPKNQTQFTMTDNAINYSKIRIWGFVEYYKMIYLDGDTLVFENIDHLFDIPNGYFYCVNDYFYEKTWSQTPKYQIGYCQQCPDASLYFNTGMFVFGPSLSVHDDLLDTLKGTHPTPFAEQVEKIKSLEQEFGSLNAEKEQLANALAISEAEKEQLANALAISEAEKEQLLTNALAIAEDSIEAAKHEGWNEATAVYEVQLARLENMSFENGSTS